MIGNTKPAADDIPERDKQGAFRIWKEPLLHFFVLGLAVFGLHVLLEEKPEPADDPLLVEVTSADIEWFRTMWNKRMGREPTVEELRGELNQLIREHVLSREAVSMGLDADDQIVRQRLTQKMNFIFEDLSGLTEPSDTELRDYLNDNRNMYERPGLVSFTHIYFNADRRGREDAEKAAENLANKLNTAGGIPQDILELGDRFLLPSSYSNKSMMDISREFGPDFAIAVRDLKPDTWSAPVVSGFGLHAVYVSDQSNPVLPDFSELKEVLRMDWMTHRQKQHSRKAYQALRSRYRVLVEGLPYDLDVDES